jgi:hypothetical protein
MTLTPQDPAETPGVGPGGAPADDPDVGPGGEPSTEPSTEPDPLEPLPDDEREQQ